MGISVWQIFIILAIVLLLFGTRKLRSARSDMGEAISGFRRAVRDEADDGKTDVSLQVSPHTDKHTDTS